jgi:hypothetical protein
MRTRRNHFELLFAGVMAIFSLYSCNTGTPGEAVRSAMEREMIREKAEEYIAEHDVPAVVVDEFNKNQSDTIERQWLVYKKMPEEEINVELPDVYIVAFKKDNQNYRTRYSKEGEVIDRNRSANLSVLPDAALDILRKGEYKDWQIEGDVFEILDNETRVPTGYFVRVTKDDQTEKLFFDLDGQIVKINTISE